MPKHFLKIIEEEKKKKEKKLPLKKIFVLPKLLKKVSSKTYKK